MHFTFDEQDIFMLLKLILSCIQLCIFLALAKILEETAKDNPPSDGDLNALELAALRYLPQAVPTENVGERPCTVTYESGTRKSNIGECGLLQNAGNFMEEMNGGQREKDEVNKGRLTIWFSKFLIPASRKGCCRNILKQQQKSSPGRDMSSAMKGRGT